MVRLAPALDGRITERLVGQDGNSFLIEVHGRGGVTLGTRIGGASHRGLRAGVEAGFIGIVSPVADRVVMVCGHDRTSRWRSVFGLGSLEEAEQMLILTTDPGGSALPIR